MFDKIGRGWQLAVLSFGILKENKSLLVLPLLSFCALVVVFCSFLVPGWALGARFLHSASTRGDQVNGAVLGFLFYWVSYTVVTFFNVALVGVVLERLEARDADVSTGLSLAVARLPAIIFYAAIAATVGMALRLIQERVGWIGQIIVALIGMVWSVAVALVVPVLAAEEIGPIEAIRRSGELIKQSWGEGLVSYGSIGWVTGLAIALTVLVGGLATIGVLTHDFIALALLLGAMTALAVAVLVLVQATLTTINLAVLYRFANGELTPGYDQELLAGAFRPKKG